MALPIDTISYNKAKVYPEGHGYELRSFAPTSILVHTTNNASPTALEQELNYLHTTRRASAHFLISKAGAIYQFLDPRIYAAWHAGASLVAFSNPRSIGIEMHVSLGEKPTQPQLEALTALVRDLMRQFSINAPMVETHRFAARPIGRKRDPEGMSDAQFYAWRARLNERRYRFLVDTAALTSNDPRVATLAPSRAAPHIWRAGDVVVTDDVSGGFGHAADGVGFFPVGYTEAV